MRSREAKTPAKDEQLDLPFDRRPKTARTNGAEPLAVRIPDAVRMTGIGRSKLYQLIASPICSPALLSRGLPPARGGNGWSVSRLARLILPIAPSPGSTRDPSDRPRMGAH